MYRFTSIGFVFMLMASALFGQTFDERFTDWPVDLKINGTVAVSDSESSFAAFVAKTSETEGGKRAALLTSVPDHAAVLDVLKSRFAEVQLLADPAQIAAVQAFDAIIWFDTRSPDELSMDEVAKLSESFRRHVDSGGLLHGVGPAAVLLGRWYLITTDGQLQKMEQGMNLIPDSLIVSGFDEASDKDRMSQAIQNQPRCVGVGVESEQTLILSGRKMLIAGSGHAHFILAGNDRQAMRGERITEIRNRASPETWMVDLTEWRRDAIDRTLEPFPPERMEVPLVEKGSLVIVGGGGVPDGIMERFIELAGGVEKAKLVYVPCAEQEDVSRDRGMMAQWESMGVKSVAMIHTKDRKRANEDASFYAPLLDATGIWFGGGRQWNLADSYYGTTTHRCMKEVVQRGGVVGGSSAGASIQARYLARATPIENFRIMAPGYERGGLGFIAGVAIDQHFSQRGRQKDMTQLVDRYPQLLGIGIDESTAIVVQQSRAEVVGQGKVFFYDRQKPAEPEKPDHIALGAGSVYDLEKRHVMKAAKDD